MKNFCIALLFIFVAMLVMPAAQAQTVHLSWLAPTGTAPSCGAISTYNVYKSTVSNGQLIPNKLVVVNVPTTTYDDHAVSFGQTYYYKVTSWSNGCAKESAFSNESVAPVPTQIIIVSPTSLTNNVTIP